MSIIFIRGRYYSRVLVPVNLRPLVGRVEIRKSLRVKGYSTAKLLAGRWEGRIAHLFATLHTRGMAMTLEQIKRLVQTYITEELESQETWRMSFPNGQDDDQRDTMDLVLTDRLAETTGQLQRNDYKAIAKKADDLLQRHRRTLAKSSEAYHRLCRELLKAEQVIMKRELERQDGHYWSPEGVPTMEAPTAPSKLISDVLPEYFQTYARRRAQSNKEKARVIQRFIECVGDKPLAEVTKADCKLFRDSYLKLPKRVSPKDRHRPMMALLKHLEGKTYQSITKQTVNDIIKDMSHLFSWASKQEYYPGKNPFDGVVFEGIEHDSYDSFTDADLAVLFTAPEFLNARTGTHPGYYWMTLLLAFTGARRGEIAKLRVEDIRHEDGVWYFDLIDEGEEGKRLKTKHSRRRVPIHSRLLELGFLEMMPQHGRLFQKEALKRFGDAYTKWFRLLRTSLQIVGKKPPHSWRHTMITKLTSAGVPQDMREILLGHQSTGVHGQVYTHREAISLTLLQEHLEKLKLPV
ncbi:MAG: site-specific integrase [Nitrospira sp.]|nr:site-specific integrase [Nitrospira sp.]